MFKAGNYFGDPIEENRHFKKTNDQAKPAFVYCGIIVNK